MVAKVFAVSLGCSKNHCDLENMIGILINNDYEITLDEYEADVALINTCGFIESAKEEAIENILEISKLKKEGSLKVLIVAGCLAQRYKEEILEQFEEVDAVVGVFDFDKIDTVIKETLNGQRNVYFKNDDSKNLNGLPRVQLTPFYTAYLKIAEGCDNRCSYCAIPYIRGGYKSRELNSLVNEAADLADNGVKELIIVAQDTTRYGLDLYGKLMLPKLLNKLSEIDGIEWIRLHYLYPEMVTDELIDVIKNNKKVLNYFDIPIQHINDRILKLMNRRSDKATILNVIKKIRSNIPDSVIRTTVITGFPTETEEEFNELYDFIKEIKFDRLGAFAYSKEEGTPAYNLKGQILKRVKEKRKNAILKLQKEIIRDKSISEIGNVYDVLTEGYHTKYNFYFGRTYKDSVEIDGTVYFKSDEEIEFGDIVKVKINSADDYDLIGEVID